MAVEVGVAVGGGPSQAENNFRTTLDMDSVGVCVCASRSQDIQKKDLKVGCDMGCVRESKYLYFYLSIPGN